MPRHQSSGRLINSDHILSDSVMVALLECRVSTRLHRLDSLPVADGIPLSRSTSYFSAERFPGIIKAYAETGPITEALRREGVVAFRRRETRLTAECVVAKGAELLSCVSDAVVLTRKAIDVDLKGQPVQFIRTKVLAARVALMMLQT